MTSALMLLAAVTSASAEDSRLRMVLATKVACRSAPESAAPAVRAFQLGDRLYPRKEFDETDPWLFDASSRCWVSTALTTPYDRLNREPALLAAADHILARRDPVPFEDYVAVENLLLRTGTAPYSEVSVLSSSGLLQFRRLQIITRAAARPEAAGRAASKAPLTNAWLIAHDSFLKYFDPDDSYYVSVEVYWRLFDGHKTAPWAEELAWAAAQMWIPTDECDSAECALGKFEPTFARYWALYPEGRHVGEALSRAAELARYGASVACHDGPEPGTPEFAAKIRESLKNVRHSNKEGLIRHLQAVEGACTSRAGAGRAEEA